MVKVQKVEMRPKIISRTEIKHETRHIMKKEKRMETRVVMRKKEHPSTYTNVLSNGGNQCDCQRTTCGCIGMMNCGCCAIPCQQQQPVTEQI